MAGGISFHVSISGINELIGRMRGVPSWLPTWLSDTMTRSLRALQEAVPPYPPPPMGSKYVRTEKLGRSLGSGFGGGASGTPDIFEVTMSGGATEGRYGSRLGYAEYVVGEGTQAEVHAGIWWTVRTILNNALKVIEALWSALGERIAAYINGS